MKTIANRADAARLEALVADLQTRVEALEAARNGRRDAAADARLLSVIAATFGSSVFSARDLRRRADADRELRAVLQAARPRAIGAWLRRLHGTDRRVSTDARRPR